MYYFGSDPRFCLYSEKDTFVLATTDALSMSTLPVIGTTVLRTIVKARSQLEFAISDKST